MAAEIMGNYGEDVSSLTLIPGHKGVHKIFINDELIFDKKEAGRFPEPADVFEKILAKLG